MNFFTKATKAFIRGYNKADDVRDTEFIADGYNGSIELHKNKICIKRKGLLSLMTQGVKGDKDIMISSISSMQLKKAGLLFNGYLQFTFIGSQEAKAGIFEGVSDENTVLFTSGQQANFLKLKNMIEKRIEAKNTPTVVTTSSVSSADEIMKFANLREKGIITEEEFLQKKKEFLGL